MERPQIPQLDAILSAVEELRAAEKAVTERKARLASRVDELASVVDPQLKLAAAAYAYWFAPEVNANQLGLLTTGKASPVLMLKAAGAVSFGVACDRCQADIPIRSRTHLRGVQQSISNMGARYAEGYRVLCDLCWEAVQEQRWANWEEQREAREARDRELARLTYDDYLLTSDWLDRRDYALANTLLAEHHALCAVCEERENLSAVHLAFDLDNHREKIELMCGTCSTALAGAGKLAVTPRERNRVRRVHLDALARKHLGESSPGWLPEP